MTDEQAEDTPGMMRVYVDVAPNGKTLIVMVSSGGTAQSFAMGLTHAYEFVRALDKAIRKLASTDETAQLFEDMLRENGGTDAVE